MESEPHCLLGGLFEDVESLRAKPPPYVSCVGRLGVPAMICDASGHLRATKVDEGVWNLTLHVRGSEENDAYNHSFRVEIRFSDKWPKVCPQVSFRGIFNHAFVDDSGNAVKAFSKTIPRGADGMCTLPLLLRGIHDLLVDPLRACRISSESIPKRLSVEIALNEAMQIKRWGVIQKYREQAKHSVLFQYPPVWHPEWFDAGFWKAQTEGSQEAWRAILTDHFESDIFSFKIFTDEFCDMLLEEIFNFYASGLPAARPNNMNKYGIILNDIGLEPMIDELQQMLQPLGEILWPAPSYGCNWDGHHCFIVRYREGEDLGLDMHEDDSEVTFNICLGLDFAGAGLAFCGHVGDGDHRKHRYTFQHTKGTCIVHPGNRRHGADDITHGERLNLILWNHSSTYRESDVYDDPPYVKENGPPDLLCVSYTHDRDYAHFKEYPTGKDRFRGRGWCPPYGFEYDGFRED